MERRGGVCCFPGVPLLLVGPHRPTSLYWQFCAYCSHSHSRHRIFHCLHDNEGGDSEDGNGGDAMAAT